MILNQQLQISKTIASNAFREELLPIVDQRFLINVFMYKIGKAILKRI
jgi:hypothetical protein